MKTPSPASQSQSQSLKVGADGHVLGSDEWIADRILDEKAAKFLVSWEGVDPKTGKGWLPTWEPKGNSGWQLLEQWEEDKKEDPDIVGKGRKALKERIRADQREAEQAVLDSGGRARGARVERAASIASSDKSGRPPRSKGKALDKRKRDSTVSMDAPPPAKKRGRAGTGAKENPIAVDSPEKDLGDDTSELSSELTPPDRPRRAAAPSSKARENKAQVASSSKAGSSTTPARSLKKANGSSSPSKLRQSTSAHQIANEHDDTPARSTRDQTSTPPTTDPPAAVSPRASSRNISVNASPVSKKTNNAALPLPLPNIAATSPSRKSKAPEKDNQAGAPSPARPTRSKQVESLSSPTPPTSPETERRITASIAPQANKKALGSAPQIEPDVFHPYLQEKDKDGPSKASKPSAGRYNIEAIAAANAARKHPHGTQSTTTTGPSQTDPIAQFSSPIRSPAQSSSRRLPGAVPVSPPPSAPPALEPSAIISPSRPKAVTEQRIIDGTEITVLVQNDSDSSFGDESDGSMSIDGQVEDGPEQVNGEGEETADEGDEMEVEPQLPSTSVVDMDAVEVTVAETTTVEVVPAAESEAAETEVHGVTLRVVKVESPQASTTRATDASNGESSSTPRNALGLVPTETDIPAADNDHEEPPATVIIEEVTTEMIVEETIPPPALSATNLRAKPSSHLFSRNHRSGSRTSDLRSRDPTPSDGSDSATKESTSPLPLMQTILDEVAQHTEEIERLKNRLAAELENGQFIKGQLNRAHEVIGALRQEKEEDTQTITLLQEQLRHGLAQQRTFALSIQKKRDEEVREVRAQNKFLLEQARLTDDTVRNRAARYPALRKEHDQCAGRYQEVESRVEYLSARNNELSEQIALLRARLMGVMDGEDASEDGHASNLSSPYSSEYDQKRTMAPRKSAPGVSGAGAGAEKDVLRPEDKVKRCLFADVGAGCDLVFTDEEAHLRHIMEHKSRLGIDPVSITAEASLE